MSSPEFSADTTMRDLLEEYPGAQQVLMRRYHIGGCSSCGFEPGESLGAVLARHNVLNVSEVIQGIQSNHLEEQRTRISPQELSESLQSDTPPRLIDVRQPEERAIVKLDGALHGTQELAQEMVDSWPKDTAIVTYCHHGIRSLDAASHFISHGFTNVRSLSGGIDAWAEQIDPSLPRY